MHGTLPNTDIIVTSHVAVHPLSECRVSFCCLENLATYLVGGSGGILDGKSAQKVAGELSLDDVGGIKLGILHRITVVTNGPIDCGLHFPDSPASYPD